MNKSLAFNSSYPVFLFISKNSSISQCHGSIYIDILPLRLPPPWSTYLDISFIILSIGTIPLDLPLVPLTFYPLPLILCIDNPIPPEPLDIRANYLKVSKMPSIESSFIYIRKQELNWQLFNPELNNVGVACIKYPFDIKL